MKIISITPCPPPWRYGANVEKVFYIMKDVEKNIFLELWKKLAGYKIISYIWYLKI